MSVFRRGRKKTQTLNRKGQRSTKDYIEEQTGQKTKRKRGLFGRKQVAKTPHGLTPVVTPKAGQSAADDEHLTEAEMKKHDANILPGQEHFGSTLGNKYEFVRYLGHGSYGHVCEALLIETGQKVAIKKIAKVFDNDIDAKRLLRELRILRLLQNHEAIVDLIDILAPNNLNTFNEIVLVFEFVDTDLAKLIQSDQYFTTLHVQYMVYQILLGLKYMHSANIAHRDLKPANILVNEDCTLKICDFGLARGIAENIEQPAPVSQEHLSQPTDRKAQRKALTKKKPKRAITRHVVTRWYRSPEVILLQQRRDMLTAVDMWSVGCIFAELLQMQKENCRVPSHRKPLFPGSSCFPLSAKDPFAYADRLDQLNVIFDVIGTPSPEEIDKLTDDKARKYLYSLPKKPPMNMKRLFPGAPNTAISLLRGLIHFDVDQRVTVDEALAHPFLQRVRDEEAEKQHEQANFEFEDIAVSLHQLRALIVDEIIHHNPDVINDLKRQSSNLNSSDLSAATSGIANGTKKSAPV